ncbi:hypothetical protein GOODEAATRI_018382 [Goodea atripinnis]|uniref:Uncharacterized protein n=1 Tax=Goodea atripinnis TaxID=208336 RepID=A0ABV0NW14_9TELE
MSLLCTFDWLLPPPQRQLTMAMKNMDIENFFNKVSGVVPASDGESVGISSSSEKGQSIQLTRDSNSDGEQSASSAQHGRSCSHSLCAQININSAYNFTFQSLSLQIYMFAEILYDKNIVKNTGEKEM